MARVAGPEGRRYSPAAVAPAIYLETYGCQMNFADAELILGHVGDSGYTRTTDPTAADVIC